MGAPLISGLANVIMTELEAKIDDQKLITSETFKFHCRH